MQSKVLGARDGRRTSALIFETAGEVVSVYDKNAVEQVAVDTHVRPTLEVVFGKSPAYLQKRHDPEGELALIGPVETAS